MEIFGKPLRMLMIEVISFKVSEALKEKHEKIKEDIDRLKS
jgi:hypothetical protein